MDLILCLGSLESFQFYLCSLESFQFYLFSNFKTPTNHGNINQATGIELLSNGILTDAYHIVMST